MKYIVLALILIFTASPSFADEIKTPSFTMKYFRFGTGPKTLVIIPGISIQSVMNFAEAVKESYKLLTKDFTLYLFDRREDMPSKYSVSEMAKDTAEAMKALKLHDVRIFGASQGGMIAMKIAIEQPELVHSMILGSVFHRITSEDFTAIFEGWLQLAKSGNAEALYLSLGKAIYTPSVYEASKGAMIEAAKTVTERDMNRFAIMTEGIKNFDLTDDLKKIRCPVLLIASKTDEIFGIEPSVEIKNKLGGEAEIFVYDSYGHAAYDTAPDYREHMLKFFSAH